MNEWSEIRFDEQGLVPAIIQDWRDATVLMLGYMNREALDRTLSTGQVHFWSRSRRALWKKGETSGHLLHLKDLFLDCDRDTILIKVDPIGPTCHTGAQSCFFSKVHGAGAIEKTESPDAAGGMLERIYRIIIDRKAHPQSDSYVTTLLTGGQDRILKKVVEEAGEVMLGSKNDQREEVIYEVADLLFHTLVVLGYHGISLQDIYQELASRHGKSGLRSQVNP